MANQTKTETEVKTKNQIIKITNERIGMGTNTPIQSKKKSVDLFIMQNNNSSSTLE